MRRWTLWMCGVLVVAAVSVGLDVRAQAPGAGVTHRVVPGDTLWDLAAHYLHDPFEWPRIWRLNPLIANPHQIYPNQVLQLEEVHVQTELELLEELGLLPPPPPSPIVASGGMILTGMQPVATIQRSIEGKELLGAGDLILAKHPTEIALAVEDTLTAARRVKKIYHPQSGEYLGDLIRILGEGEVVAIQSPQVQVRIFTAYDAIMPGDGLWRSFPQATREPTRVSLPQLTGVIVAAKEPRSLQAQHDVVYIDRGRRDGVHSGDAFLIIRVGTKPSLFAQKLPDQVIGELEVLTASDQTSMAQITKSGDAVKIGDLIQGPLLR